MKKKFMILATFSIFSAVTYCDIYFMSGGGTGYVNIAGNGGGYIDAFFGTQYYPFDGPIGVGLDLTMKHTFIGYAYKYETYKNGDIISKNGTRVMNGLEFIASPTLSLRLFNHRNNGEGIHPVLKFFPVFAYSIHGETNYFGTIEQQQNGIPGSVGEPYIGGGIELCLNWAKNQYPKGGGEVFLTYSQSKLLETKENCFSIEIGIRGFFRRSLREKRAAEKAELEQKQEYAARQEQIRKQQEQIRLQKAQEKQEAETAAVKSGSLDNMINFLNQYGDSRNIRLAIERVLSRNENASYKEIASYENPYGFEKGSVYFCSYMEVFQWVSEYSFLAKVNGKIIYVETSNIENVRGRISYAFLKANGVREYNSATSLNIVPRFTLMLFQ